MIDISTQSSLKGSLSKVIYWKDTEDSSKFYLWPETPRFRRDEKGKPIFSFYKYTSSKKGADGEIKGGYLSFDTEFALDDNQIEEAKKQLTDMEKPKNSVTIGIIPFTSGKVSFFAPQKNFTTRMNTTGKPSLSGRNIATVSMELSPEGATFIYDALTSGHANVLQIAYELSFDTILPATSAHIWYDSQQAYKYVRFAKVDAHACDSGKSYSDKIYKDVQEKGAGGCKVEFGNVSEDLKTKVNEWAFKTMSDMIQKSVFDSIKELEAKAPDKNDKVDINLAIQNSKSFDVNLNEKQTINYTLIPSGTLENLLSVKSSGGTSYKVSDFFSEIDLTDNFFDTYKIYPSVYDLDWKAMNLADVSITIDYGSGTNEIRRTYNFDSKGALITSEDSPYPYTHTLLHDSNKNPVWEFSYRVDADFNGGIKPYKSPFIKSIDSGLNIGPSDLYILQLDITPDNLLEWDKLREITVDLECQGAKIPQIAFTEESHDPKKIAYPIGEPAEGDAYVYNYTITYYQTDGKFNITGSTDSRSLIIQSPVQKTQVHYFQADDDVNVEHVFLTLEYKEPKNNYSKEVNDIDLVACKDRTYKWEIPVIDSSDGHLFYTGEIIFKDGRPSKEIPRTEATNKYVKVYSGSDKLELQIASDAIDWDNYKKIIVDLAYIDKNHTKTTGQVTLSPEKPEGQWRINISDSSYTTYSWSGRLITKDKKLLKTSAKNTDDNPLEITDRNATEVTNNSAVKTFLNEHLD
ncbi:MAG TPA: hypothetical protein VHP38_14730 [Ruminiclostridium sp.]|nr:hypothetical protein [Ruminiclostridium sp.]